MAEDMVKRAKRAAMLEAQLKWTDEANADGVTSTQRAIALVIADAFGREAELYKEDLSARTSGGWRDEWIDGFNGDDQRRPNGNDQLGAPLALYEEG